MQYRNIQKSEPDRDSSLDTSCPPVLQLCLVFIGDRIMPSGIYIRTKKWKWNKDSKISREIRICICKKRKCNNKFEVRINSIKKYCSCDCSNKDKKHKPHSEEHNRKIGKSLEGRIFSKERCKNISIGKKGKKYKPREIRTCKRLRCNNKFKVIITSIKRYCSHSCGSKDQKRKPHSEETKRKIGLSSRRPCSEEKKEKIRKANIGRTWEELFGVKEARKLQKERSQFIRGLWQKPEYVAKQMKARGITPNRVEKQLNNLLKELFPAEYKYVGDGQFIIGGKCPDFINVNGQKKIIELFGDYWHSEELQGRTKTQEENQRIKHFTKYGYKTLIIWQKEIKDILRLRRKLVQFHNK